MQIGDLLVASGIVTADDIAEAQRKRSTDRGSLPETLISLGVVDADLLLRFLERVPPAPTNIAETGLTEADLVNNLMKLMFVEGLESTSQFIDGMRLPYVVVLQVVDAATQRGLISAVGASGQGGLADIRYATTEQGRAWAIDALQQSQYVGPVPVSLDQYRKLAIRQKVSGELVNHARIQAAMEGLVVSHDFIDQVGPAVNSGRAMLLYGPPGNGKTSVALRMRNVFVDTVYVPHAVLVSGNVMRVFDPALHEPIPAPPEGTIARQFPPIRRDAFDNRWEPCKRPFVVTGGELTLDMLDLRYEAGPNNCEAPLHVKALGGCIVVDDFGRQLVSPTQLLNRWITPLENRIDFLRLSNGKTFSVPVEELVIFSTNLQPEDLMDEAFLRRIPYKLEVPGPNKQDFYAIFQTAARKAGMQLTQEINDYVIEELTERRGMNLSRYQAGFIVDQLITSCRYMGIKPQFDRRLLQYAMGNLRVNKDGQTQASV
jgi:hypothetical protein